MPPDVPDHVRSARLVLGEETAVAGGVRISEFYRSFMVEIERHFDLPEQNAGTVAERNRELLERFGLDPIVDDVTLFIAFRESELHSTPGFVLHAPLPKAALEKLADKWDAFEMLDEASEELRRIRSDIRRDFRSDIRRDFQNELPVFAITGEDPAILVARPSNEMLTASGSTAFLSDMIERATSASRATTIKSTSLFLQVGGADAWITATNIPAMVEAMSGDALPTELENILSAITGVGASLQLEDDAVKMNVYFEPESGIDESDLSDLVRGAIALMKLEASRAREAEVLSDVLNRIDVSESSGFSRVQLRITEQDLENLIRDVDWD